MQQVGDPRRCNPEREIDRLGRVVRPRSTHHRDATGGLVYRNRHNPFVLITRKRRRLPGRTGRHQEVDTLPDLPVYQRPQRGLVNLPRFPERRHQRRAASAEHLVLHSDSSASTSCMV